MIENAPFRPRPTVLVTRRCDNACVFCGQSSIESDVAVDARLDAIRQDDDEVTFVGIGGQRNHPTIITRQPDIPGDDAEPSEIIHLMTRELGFELLPARFSIGYADSFAFTRRLAREEALLVGGSSGMAAFAAKQLAEELAAEDRTDAVIVVLLPDSGRGYLTKVFNDEWLGSYGFPTEGDSQDRTVGEVLRGKSGQLPDLVHTHPSETVAEAARLGLVTLDSWTRQGPTSPRGGKVLARGA